MALWKKLTPVVFVAERKVDRGCAAHRLPSFPNPAACIDCCCQRWRFRRARELKWTTFDKQTRHRPARALYEIFTTANFEHTRWKSLLLICWIPITLVLFLHAYLGVEVELEIFYNGSNAWPIYYSGYWNKKIFMCQNERQQCQKMHSNGASTKKAINCTSAKEKNSNVASAKKIFLTQ